jgi:integrase
LGDRSITDLDEVQEEYRTERTSEGASEATINHEISTLSAVLHRAAKRKKIPKDSLPGEFVMVKNPSAPRRTITAEEYSKLLEAAETDQDFQDFMVCAYETAMRNTEICELTVEQVHLDRVWSEVPPTVVDYIYLGFSIPRPMRSGKSLSVQNSKKY